MAATRFVIDEAPELAPRSKASFATFASHAARWLSWLELAILMPPRVLAAVGWLAIPLFLLAIVPVAVLGALMLVQAPIFFVLWKMFGRNAPSGETPDD